MQNLIHKDEEYEIVEEEVLSVEQVKLNESVYNLEVNEDNSYTANGLIVHNCKTTTVIAYANEFPEQ